jgi:outer membrane protein
MSLKKITASTGMRTAFCAFSCLLALSTPILAKVALIPSAQQISEYEASSEALRVNLLIKLAKTGQHDLADALLKRYPLTGEFAKNRTLYIDGLILQARHDLTGAAAKYRQALASDPSLTLVRAELAQILAELQENDSAKHQLLLLEADAPNEAEAQGIRSFIDTIDARRPLTFNTYVSIAPSSNINNGSSNKTVYSPVIGGNFDIDPSSQETSGIGFSTGARAGYSKRLGNDYLAVLSGGIDARIYDDSNYNSYATSQSAEMRYLLDGGFLSLGVISSQTLKSKELEMATYSYGPRVGLQFTISPKNRINASSSYEWIKNIDDSLYNSEALIIDGSLNHAFSSSFNTTLSIGFDRINTKTGFTSYKTYSSGMGIYKELPYGLTTTLNGELRHSDFDAMNPLAGVIRKDDRLTGSVGLMKRDFNIFGYAPAIEYTYVHNSSNISLYDFNSHAVDFRLSKDF